MHKVNRIAPLQIRKVVRKVTKKVTKEVKANGYCQIAARSLIALYVLSFLFPQFFPEFFKQIKSLNCLSVDKAF